MPAVVGVLARTADPAHPDQVQIARPTAALAIGAAAGLYLAVRAARPAPTEALRAA